MNSIIDEVETERTWKKDDEKEAMRIVDFVCLNSKVKRIGR